MRLIENGGDASIDAADAGKWARVRIPAAPFSR